MIEFEEYRQKLNNLKPELDELGAAYDLERAKEEIEELENRASEPGFWDDMEKSQKVLQRTKALKDKVEGFAKLTTQYEDLLTLCELALEMEDDSMLEELQTGYDEFTDELDRRKLATLLTGEYDRNNAILSFHAGAGGTEAQDWCEMLYRMYTRWTERHG
ncbi:MAG: PCRF domain-containing protein, partial [Butyricicoccaceae bacterium]